MTEVTQDEPVNGLGDGDTSPDAVLQGQGAPVLLRAERAGSGNGRVYQVEFTAAYQSGESCDGTVRVEVPHSRGRGVVAVDDGQYYISTQP